MIATRRMHAQHLWGSPMGSADEVVRWLGAMQAQEFVPAKWAVAQRAEGLTDAAMSAMVDDGIILRTHVLRPTWHFVLPEDIRWLLAATGPRVQGLNAYQYRALGLDDEVFAASNRLLADALAGGRQMTRKEIGAHLDRHGITASGLRLGYVLMRAELDAVVVSGALRGRQQTYALFDDRVPAADPVTREEAVARLTLRYFRSRGPATVRDYVRWSSLTIAEARAGLEAVCAELESADVDGRTYWYAPGGAVEPVESPRIDLVQGYDEYVMSYSESRDVLGPLGFSGPERAAHLHAILLDGRLIGRWKHTAKAREIVVETSVESPLDDGESVAMDRAVRRLGDYFELDARWR